MLRRINITGNAGSGKTTVTKRLGELIGLPVYHLDAIVWQPKWQKTPPEDRLRLENELTDQEAWIIDGVSRNVREKADLVVFLDVPRGTCIVRVMKRNLPYLFHSRPELPDNCPEILIFPKLVRLIMRFPKYVRTSIIQEAERNDNYVIVKSNEELRSLLKSIANNMGRSTEDRNV